MIIISTNQHNGTKVGVNIFYAAPILSGEHIGKFATNENALKEFSNVFENLEYEIVELENSAFEVDYNDKPLVNGFRLIQVNDLYNGTIEIHLMNEETREIKTLKREYIDTWDDEDVFNYVEEI